MLLDPHVPMKLEAPPFREGSVHVWVTFNGEKTGKYVWMNDPDQQHLVDKTRQAEEVEIEIDDDDYLPEGGEPPSYGDPGRILVHLIGPGPSMHQRYETEVMDYDPNTSVFYINAGVGFDYWIDQHIEFPSLDEGYYVIEGITGEYINGEWGFTDDDEEWSFTSMRPATDDEISTGALPPKPTSP